MNEDEISLKELILIIVKGWKWILGITFATSILSLFVFFGFNSGTYQLVINGNIIKSDNYSTLYGDFPAHTIKNSDLIDLVKSESFMNRISNQSTVPFSVITTITDPADFSITLNSSNSETLNDIGVRIIDDLELYVNYSLQEKAIRYFISDNELALDRSIIAVDKNLKLIEVLTQKLSTINPAFGNEIINPEYSIFSTQRANIEYETIRIESDIEKIKSDLENLTQYKTGNFSEYLESENQLDTVSTLLNFKQLGTAQQIQRFNILTLIPISIMAGGMLGVFMVFFLHYWKNN